MSGSSPTGKAAAVPQSVIKTLLLVEDSIINRTQEKRILEAAGYEVIIAVDGMDAFSKLNELKVDAVVSDIQMPNLDGYGLICRIRGSQEERIKAVPIIVVTSADDDTSRQRANACGANDFIVQPFTPTELIQRAKYHTEGGLGGAWAPAHKVNDSVADIEDTVIEAPSIAAALDIIGGSASGSLDPYITELCQQVLPLLEYCSEKNGPDMTKEIESIKKKLASF